MTPERWQQIKYVFHSALEYEPAQRPSFLLRACDQDPALREEVESLLAAHEKDGSFIDSPAYQAAAALGMENGPTTLNPGQLLGDYEISAFIGRGGMGEVYLAQDSRLRRKVALKLLPSFFTKDAGRLQRFEQEARAASALNHPNIITIYEIREAASSHLIATEFVEGETLRNRMNRSALSVSEALEIAIQVADALSAAHKAGIVHRDIKPENIMVRPDGYVKVLDFGLAKLGPELTPVVAGEASTRVFKTGSGVVVGTVGYMSPEQARGQNVDPRSDIFSLGAVIYEMVAGHKPFSGETPSDTFAALLKTEPAPLSSIDPDTPAELTRIVTKALRKDREQRYQVVKDLLLDLKSLKEDLDFQAKLDRAPSTTRVGDTRIQTPRDTGHIKTPISAIETSRSVAVERRKFGVVLLVATFVLIVVGGIALYKLLNPKPVQTNAPSRVVKTTQVTFSPGLDGFPSLSPDGKSVAYSSDQNGSFEIYIKQLAPGGGELRLTDDGQQNLHPAWSPDGQRIAYYSRKRGGIWVVPALGGVPRQLTDTGAKPVWSPDGSSIAFQSAGSGEISTARTLAPSTIWIIPAQGGTAKQISQPGNPAGGHNSPAFSPDGKRIAFEVSDYISSSIWSMAVDGTDVKKIIEGRQPIYAGDGSYLYFLAGDRIDSNFSSIRVSTAGEPIGEPTVVMRAGAGTAFGQQAISFNGRTLLYGVERTVSNLWTVSVLPNGDAAGPPSPFAPDTSSRNSLPRFSPDGAKIALNRWRPETSVDIWVADADGKNLTQLTNNPGVDSQVSWLPGGDKLAFLSVHGGKYLKLWTVSVSTGKQEPLLDLGEGVQFALVSPDGKQVAYNFIQNGIMNVWLASVPDGKRKQLTFDNEMSGFPCWSNDGKWIAYEMKRGQDDHLMLISPNGGQPAQLTFAKGRSWPNSFSPDNDKIVFSGQRDGIWNIYSISISTKAEKRLTNYTKLNSFVRYPSWSRNQIVYEYAETTGNLWLAELN